VEPLSNAFGHHDAVTFTIQLTTKDGEVAWADRVYLILGEDDLIRHDYTTGRCSRSVCDDRPEHPYHPLRVKERWWPGGRRCIHPLWMTRGAEPVTAPGPSMGVSPISGEGTLVARRHTGASSNKDRRRGSRSAFWSFAASAPLSSPPTATFPNGA
jgi:hypothetical protein